MRAHTFLPSPALKKEEGNKEDKSVASSCIAEEEEDGKAVLPVVAAAKDIGKLGDGKSSVSKESGTGELTK